MADGTLFERRGIPAASICTDSFSASGSAMAKLQGYPGYRFAMIPHPLSSLTPEQVKERAGQVLTEVLSILGIADEV
ncbi:MAG: hypothetical protein KGJ86_02340 [Chloroflexota bacterium]|nr:hypothetical protein [Chloroflexota bacterium]